MSFTQNQLLDFNIYLRRATINQEVIGGDARLLQIAEELLRVFEAGDINRLEEEANDPEEKVDELADKLSEAAALLSHLDDDDYRRVQDGERLSSVENFDALVRLLSDYE